jgi:MFS family permease
VATGVPVALASRFLTGFMLAGVYPPAMKMIATWFRRNRGLAIGTVVGALTVGKATPYLLKTLPEMGLKGVSPGGVRSRRGGKYPRVSLVPGRPAFLPAYALLMGPHWAG